MNYPPPCHLATPRRRAFTLIETVVSVSVASILLIGMGSTILIATKAMPDDLSPQAQTITTSIALEQLNTEIQSMIQIIEHTPTAITFTVPDRNNDNNPERIRYTWDTSRGSPLTRQLNQNTPATFIPNINQFNLTYQTAIASQLLPGAATEDAAESLLIETGVADHYHTLDVSKSDAAGQFIKPNLSPTALSYRPTRLTVYTRYNPDNSGLVSYQVKRADELAQPFGPDLAATTFGIIELTTTFRWLNLPFTIQPLIQPTDAIALLITAPSTNGAVQLETDPHIKKNGGRLTSEDEGLTWQYLSDKSLRVRLYGTVTYPSPDWMLHHETLSSVNASIRTNSNTTPYTHTAVPTPNNLPFLSANWQLDFSTNPTDSDCNADGSSDWDTVAGSSDPESTDFDNGIWNAQHVLRTQPDNDFTQPLILTTSIRDTDYSNTSGPAFELYIDREINTHGLIAAELILQPDNTQTLTIQYAIDKDTREDAIVVNNLPNDFVKLKIIVDPDQDLFYVEVNDIDRGAYTYPRFDGFSTAAIIFGQQETGSQFDSLTIEVKE